MLRYLILIGLVAAMPLPSFAAAECAAKGAAEPAANWEQSKTEGPVWVVEATKSLSSQGPVWVVMKPKGSKTVS
jgi:hypothetical protein